MHPIVTASLKFAWARHGDKVKRKLRDIIRNGASRHHHRNAGSAGSDPRGLPCCRMNPAFRPLRSFVFWRWCSGRRCQGLRIRFSLASPPQPSIGCWMANEQADTSQKALQLNLDAKRYGTFAEIGAGQEVARWFFRVGGAAGTVAKTISAYDMAVSDAIYGATERYVSRRRLQAMLDYEYQLLLERLDKSRGGKNAFFVFANTVATRREGGNGWLGIRFQAESGSDPSEILMHVRMLDKEHVRQQEALGVIGVNLIHGSFYLYRQPDLLIRSLLDNLTWERVEVDMIRFAGPAFPGVDNRLMALQLVKEGLTEAAMFTAEGEAIQWAEVLYKKPVLVQRGSFRPVTKATLDVLERGLEQFMMEPDLKGEQPVVLMEMTLRHLTTGAAIDATDFLQRTETLKALGKTVLVS